MTALLEVADLDAGYGATRVLHDVSLQVAAGEAVAVLGANGAGKTTLMNVVAGLVRPTRGRIRFAGEDVTATPAAEMAALGVALAPEGRGIFATLSVEENLLVGATPLRRRWGGRRARAEAAGGLAAAYAMFPVLQQRRSAYAGALSGGQQQMLAIARALMSCPTLLIMDEPCLGLAPKIGQEVYATLDQLRASSGLTVIVVEESSQRALGFADRACVLKLGRKVLDDATSAVAGDGRLLDAYFGVATGSTGATVAAEQAGAR